MVEMVIAQSKCSHIRLAIVCPMANEMSTAAAFVQEVMDVCRPFHFKDIRFYAIFDLASRDGTKDALEALVARQAIQGLEIIFAPENRNVVDAYKRGYREALSNDFDWILEIDAGYSHQPADIPQFFHTMLDGGFDCVFGSRFLKGGRITGGSLSRYLVSFGGTQLTNLLLGTGLQDMTSGFELFRKEALEWILKKGIFSRGPFFQTEIKAHAHHFKIAEVPINYRSATHHVHQKALLDALKNLSRLCSLRWKNELSMKKSNGS